MAILNARAIAQLNQGILDRFQNTLNATTVDIERFINTAPTSTEANVIPFLTAFSGLERWVSDKKVKNIGMEKMTVTVDNYAVVFEVPRNAIRFDQVGLYGNAITQFAQVARRHKADRIIAALKAGKTIHGFDAKPTFATDHDTGNGLGQSNLLTGMPLTAENLQTVYTLMSGYAGNENNVLGVQPTTLLVPPALAFKAREILAAPFLPGGGTNTMNGLLDIAIINGFAVEPTVWYLLDQTQSPLNYLEAQAPRVIPMTADTDPGALMRNVYEYHIEAIGEAFLGPWMSIVRCEG